MRLEDLKFLSEEERIGRLKVIEEAKNWLDTPYHHYAKIKGVGVDCAMFLVGVYENVGLVEQADIGEYEQEWHLHRNEEKYLERIKQWLKPTDNPLPADICLFKFGRTVSHSAILVNYPLVIHSYYQKGVCYDEIDNGKLANRIHSYWTFWSKN